MPSGYIWLLTIIVHIKTKRNTYANSADRYDVLRFDLETIRYPQHQINNQEGDVAGDYLP